MASAHFAVDMAATHRLRAGIWGLSLLAMGLTSFLWTGQFWWQDHALRLAEQETLSRLEAALADRGAASRAAAAHVPGAAERRAQVDLSRLSVDLFRPWFPLLDALEASASPRVSVQQLAIDSAFTRLQLRVDAADLPEVLQYVQALDRVGGPVQGAQLVGHEWLAPAGAPPRLQARISVALVAPGVASVAPTPPVSACGADPATRCLSAKAP